MKTAGNSQIMRTITLIITIFSLSLPAYAQYSGGTGKPNNPYQITTADDLMLLGESPEDYDKHFKIMADIDLSGYSYDRAVIAPDINDTDPGFQGTAFSGSFDGNDHEISNMTVTGEYYLGLFGMVESQGEISNLGIVDVNVISTGGDSENIGGLLGANQGSVANCYSSGTVSGEDDSIGGLVGRNYGFVMSCYSTATVSGDDDVGGLIGENHGTITKCNSTGIVSGDNDLGGLAGHNKGDISDCYSTGSISGDETVGGFCGQNNGAVSKCFSTATVMGKFRVGGLVGYNYGRVTTSYSTSTVTGIEDVGGLVGENDDDGSITTSYTTGAVTGERDVGGLVGDNDGSITTSYSTGTVTGDFRVGGLVGYNNDDGSITSSFWDIDSSGVSQSQGGIGLTTAEMQDINTYLDAGWDFVDEILNGTCDYWQISPGDYPQLRYHAGNVPVMPEGLGTAEEPYLIRSIRDLGTVWFKPMAHYRLETSLDLSGITWSMAVVPWFYGTFDGNGFVIRNMLISGNHSIGMFGTLIEGSQVKDLIIEDANITGMGDHVGILAGFNQGNVINCYCSGESNGNDNAAGLIGMNTGSLARCNSTASVNGNNRVGGLAGHNKGDISDCYSTSAVFGGVNVGGLIGTNSATTFNCYSMGIVKGSNWVGGLIGSNDADLHNSHSSSIVSGNDRVGALVGVNKDLVSDCYSSGESNGNDYVGGLIGENIGSVIYCNSTCTVSGNDYVGGLIGKNGESISHCYSNGQVQGGDGIGGLIGYNAGKVTYCQSSCTVSGKGGVGGLVGSSYGRRITHCNSTGSASGHDRIGGLIGHNQSMIYSCYSTAAASGNETIGGLIGRNYEPIIDCYSTGVVVGENEVGGLTGLGGQYTARCFWDTETSGIKVSSSGTGLTTKQMQDINTYLETGWDFLGLTQNGLHEHWHMPEGNAYPILNISADDQPPTLEGNGTVESPFLISTPADLGAIIHNDLTAHYSLTNDIDLAGITWSVAVIPEFEGVFDGKSHVIRNLHIQGWTNLGLFGNIARGSEVKWIGLDNVFVQAADDYFGSFAGIGGLAGRNNGRIFNCYSTGTVLGNGSVGGLVGFNGELISRCYSTGIVSGSGSVGGLVGHTLGSVSNSYSSAQLNGGGHLGGLIGLGSNSTSIHTCYSTGAVPQGRYHGGLIGRRQGMRVSLSFWDIETSGLDNSSGGMGLSTAEMQTASTFLEAFWDIVDEVDNGTEDIWWILEGQDYPRLWWESIE